MPAHLGLPPAKKKLQRGGGAKGVKGIVFHGTEEAYHSTTTLRERGTFSFTPCACLPVRRGRRCKTGASTMGVSGVGLVMVGFHRKPKVPKNFMF